MKQQPEDDDSERPGRARLDKWLWAARFYKTRALASEAIASGKIEISGDRAKRSRLVQVGDTIRLRMGPYEHVIHVTGVSSVRGSATIAATLYQETEESRKARDAMAIHVRAMNANTGYDSGRPTKKDRRDIEKIRRRES